MKNKKIFSSILLLCCLLASLMAMLTACKSDGFIPFVEEEKKKGPQFLEGALDTVYVDETVVLTEYIDYDYNSEYKVVITDANGVEQDITYEVIWYSEVPGKFVITYSILSGKNKGSSSFELNVIYPDLEFQYSLQYKPYNLGDTLNFEEYFADMNVWTSIEGTVVAMQSVIVDGQEIDLTNAKEYTFESRSDHTFKFSATATDGQVIEGREVISIKYVDQAYLKELTDMGITMDGDLYVERGNFTLVEGSYANGNNVILQRVNGPHYSPYIAYNGEYGIGSYVKVDFTGKNMPIFSFFRDDYTSSLFDGSKGIMFTGGLKNNSGSYSHPDLSKTGLMYGPNMLHKPDEAFNANYKDTAYLGDSTGKINGTDPHPVSLQGLKDGTKYRIMIGFSKIEKTSATHLFTKEPNINSVKLTLSCALINLDTMQMVSKFNLNTYALQALGFEGVIPTYEEYLASGDYFKGNIVLYGNYGERTVLDKIYPIVTDKNKTFEQVFAEDLQYSKFKSGAKTFVLGTSRELNVADYVDTSKEGYKFYYSDSEGKIYNVTGDKFTISKPGSYLLYYSDGKNLCSTLPFTLANLSAGVQTWIINSNINLHGVSTISEDKKVVLDSGTMLEGASVTGPNAGSLINQSFIAFDGDYAFNDYLVFDFTGKNMPEVAFFAQNYNNSMYYQDGGKHGIVFANGITNYKGEIAQGILGDGKYVNIDSPRMIEHPNDSWYKMDSNVESLLARANLVDGTRYRVIMWYETGSRHGANGIKIKWQLYNLDTNALLEAKEIHTYGFYNGGTHAGGKVSGMTLNDLKGSIVLYGKFGVDLTIDKLWGVYEDTNIDSVLSALGMN